MLANRATPSALLGLWLTLSSGLACSVDSPSPGNLGGQSAQAGAPSGAGGGSVGGLSGSTTPAAGSGQGGTSVLAGGGASPGAGGSVPKTPGGATGSGGTPAHAGSSNGGSPTGHAGAPVGAGGAGGAGGGGNAGGAGDGDDYDALVLAEHPVAYWGVNMAPNQEQDLTGNGHEGQYRGSGTPGVATLPNGAQAADFDGAQQYLTIPSSAVFSIPTTGNLTWEAWLRPDVLQFPNDDGSSGYVDWLGKCEDYGPTCEWEARMYSTQTNESPNRPNRISAYVFNPSAGLGSAADWQPSEGLVKAGTWYHVVGEYTTQRAPSDCDNTDTAPGSIEIWVNGVKWDHGSHGQTGCMSQYDVVPKANGSAVNIATMAKESFFKGAIGKVAIYDQLLSEAKIVNHYTVMTAKQPTGSCGKTCSF